ncbi:MAG: U32 family peptidase [Bacilli bacterium]|nr:U32 family peptidase [Bacilli bacterium]
MNKVELLAPAGSLEKAKIALTYGADAVYVGGKQFSLRARASNFDLKDLEELASFAHNLNKKVYVTMNIIPHDADLDGLDEYLKALDAIKIDAIITSSRYIMERAKEVAASLELHLSTQMSTTTSLGIDYYHKRGVSRVVLAREVTLCEIEQIMKKTNVEIEVFVHGGMCSSYSGHCVLSNHMTNRDANRGGCAHSCRWNYTLYKNGEKQPMFYNIGSKDLMALKFIPKLLDLGVASLKIEGRMKSSYYLAVVIRSYRMLIDAYYEKGYVTEEDLKKSEIEIGKAENRLTSNGFFEGLPKVEGGLYDDRSEHPTKEYIGWVMAYDESTNVALIEQRNYFKVGDEVEFFGPTLPNTKMIIDEIIDYETKEKREVANHPLQLLLIKVPFKLTKDDMVRKVNI